MFNLRLLCLAMFLLMQSSLFAQPSSWVITEVTFNEDTSYDFQSFNPQLTHVVTSWYEYISVSPLNGLADMQKFKYVSRSPDWLNNTIVYYEYAYEYDDRNQPPSCTDNSKLTFNLYNAITKINELFCLTPIPSYITWSASQGTGSLERYPYDEYTVLLGRRFLIHLKTNQWTDLESELPTTVNLEDIEYWIGYDKLWWDSRTRLPVASLATSTDFMLFYDPSTTELQICPVVNDACISLAHVFDYAHGYVSDFIVAPDGQHILWSSVVFPTQQEVIPRTSVYANDIQAFVTHVQSNMTANIFTLSDYNTRTSKGTSAIWTNDGKTLVVNMKDLNNFLGSPDNGSYFVKFK